MQAKANEQSPHQNNSSEDDPGPRWLLNYPLDLDLGHLAVEADMLGGGGIRSETNFVALEVKYCVEASKEWDSQLKDIFLLVLLDTVHTFIKSALLHWIYQIFLLYFEPVITQQ